jgi:ribonucleoside-diphosphate reductase subunit M2
MDMISLQGKTNFFEKRVSDYAKAGVKHSASTPSATGKDGEPVNEKQLWVVSYCVSAGSC